MLAQTIRNHRERLGLSPERVAELAQLSRERVLALETADGAPTLSEICALGAALAFDPAVVLRGEPLSDPRRSAARFRAPHGVQELGAEDARTLARAAELGRIGAELVGLIGDRKLSLVEHRDVKALRSHPKLWHEGYTLGEHARGKLSPAQQPLRSMQGLLEENHTHVARVPLSDERNHAVSIYEPGALAVILLNDRASRVRQRLSRRAVLAHELCHLLHDGGQGDLLTLVTRYKDEEPIERRANGFAPGFLAPREWTRAAITASRSKPIERVREIAQVWGLTFEGATWHAKNCKLITPEAAEAIVGKKEVIASEVEPSIARRDPHDVGLDVTATPLVTGLIQELVYDAYEEGCITRGRAHELLRFS
jgi:Zn-dependent peptidase ImmA (M78 family)